MMAITFPPAQSFTPLSGQSAATPRYSLTLMRSIRCGGLNPSIQPTKNP